MPPILILRKINHTRLSSWSRDRLQIKKAANGFSRQSANITGCLCGHGELGGEEWLHVWARQTLAGSQLLLFSRLWFILGDRGLSWGRIGILISDLSQAVCDTSDTHFILVIAP